jgi:hypothetical protein
MTEYKTVNLGEKLLEIVHDDYPESPREWDNLGTMAIFHRRYEFGDENIPFSSDDFNSWSEMEQHIWNKEKAGVCLPIYMYDHSGITINTTGFSCPWDSGQVGFIYVTKKKLKEEYGKVNEETISRATKVLEGEVEIMDFYISGNVYGFNLYKTSTCDKGHEHRELIDSCHGFYGDDFETNGLLDHCDITNDEKMLALREL